MHQSCSSSSHGLWLCVCVFMHVWNRKRIRLNGDVTVRLLSPHESAPEWPYWQLVCLCVHWVRAPVGEREGWGVGGGVGEGGQAFPLHVEFLRPWLELGGTRAIFHPFHMMEAVSSPAHMFPIRRCVYSPTWCARPWKPLISPILEIAAKGLLKQTQYPKSSQLTLWTMQRIRLKALRWLDLMSYWGSPPPRSESSVVKYIALWCFNLLILMRPSALVCLIFNGSENVDYF